MNPRNVSTEIPAFSVVAQASVVASPSVYRFIREQMENLPIYTEIYYGEK
jgi:hypothetical protein